MWLPTHSIVNIPPVAEPGFIQVTVLALIQGLTEFLPVSSSGHLLLPSMLLGWPDQGLAFDVAFHGGTLIAVIGYFRRDLRQIVGDGLRPVIGDAARFIAGNGTPAGPPDSTAQGRGRIPAVKWWSTPVAAPTHSTAQGNGKMLWLLLVATVPVGLAGLLLRDFVEVHARSVTVVAAASIGFGVLLGGADIAGRRNRGFDAIGWRAAMLIGFAQMLALIPGASRSGVTMTAALLLGFDREAAARFSFLLAIPVMLASGALEAIGLIAQPPPPRQLLLLAFGTALSALVAWLSIDWFLRWISRLSFQPFMAYRIALGLAMLLFLA